MGSHYLTKMLRIFKYILLSLCVIRQANRTHTLRGFFRFLVLTFRLSGKKVS